MRKSQGKITDSQNQTKYTNQTGKRHNHYTRQSQSLHTAVGKNEAIYKTLHFMALEFGTIYKQKVA